MYKIIVKDISRYSSPEFDVPFQEDKVKKFSFTPKIEMDSENVKVEGPITKETFEISMNDLYPSPMIDKEFSFLFEHKSCRYRYQNSFVHIVNKRKGFFDFYIEE